ncbi:hypothetical protein PAHAL_7G106700 [Panicum hallii]|jgi:hypothetical protein|uniref:Bifunctional inhibitor/plant lipid transfer protein/seed storage helical domain-containing protein n=1 Tax=Panicum hallii TaxID=206008 RepID=A0A2T8IBQ6_9POAL|nr:hypothetical protein PAHAL_7G106700 [Panicum hallii]
MASVCFFFLLATLTIAAATASAGYDGNTQEPYPVADDNEAKPMPEQPYDSSRPSCGGCRDAKMGVLKARGMCCQEVSRHVECLCPTMNTLIGAGVPLKEVCYDDMACNEDGPYGSKGSVVIDPSKKCSVPTVCNGVVDALLELNKCFSVQQAGEDRSGGSCFVGALRELGFKNPDKVIEKLFRH